MIIASAHASACAIAFASANASACAFGTTCRAQGYRTAIEAAARHARRTPEPTEPPEEER